MGSDAAVGGGAIGPTRGRGDRFGPGAGSDGDDPAGCRCRDAGGAVDCGGKTGSDCGSGKGAFGRCRVVEFRAADGDGIRRAILNVNAAQVDCAAMVRIVSVCVIDRHR